MNTDEKAKKLKQINKWAFTSKKAISDAGLSYYDLNLLVRFVFNKIR
ncbi:MAG: hypothetical protein HYV97_02750 [Bdellovibrio sp.]|nr:hypothetical protein [Bdellovibrio sp.]